MTVWTSRPDMHTVINIKIDSPMDVCNKEQLRTKTFPVAFAGMCPISYRSPPLGDSHDVEILQAIRSVKDSAIANVIGSRN